MSDRLHRRIGLAWDDKELRMADAEVIRHGYRTSQVVTAMLRLLAKRPRKGYDLAIRQAATVISGARYHDVGKFGIQPEILHHGGKLDQMNYEIDKLHTLLENAIARAALNEKGAQTDEVLAVAEVALYHHERWDGSGYPHGLKGDAIPLSARLVAIADTYDALVHPRPYKASRAHSEAVTIVSDAAGTLFDPYLVSLFHRAIAG